MSVPTSSNDPDSQPPALDAMAIGKSIFGEIPEAPSPEVAGYSRPAFVAEGGFGKVWRASRDRDDLCVALKIPHHADPETAERFEAEADALRALEHPHIVRLLDVTATATGEPVLVMEFIDGPPLTNLLPADGFDFEHALQLFLPILDAIAHAHDRGIIHRDLKPSNILLDGGTVPKVSDFGLAQSLREQRLAFSLTRAGVLAGTVEYLAPERYEPDAQAGPAADLYALGVILYEMLAGRPPRGAWTPLSQLKRLDVRLDALVNEAIHPDPAKRLASATVFKKRLKEIRDTKPRYTGTPLATLPVRAADTLWTAVGLYALAAGYCSLLSINNTAVPALFDLRLGHTFLLGGYWAVWILTITMGLLWAWQGIRLWRFRHIPLREALPSPFGLRLGSSPGAARLVALAQFLCAWAPLAYIGWIHSQVWFWATPDTAAWENVLAITKWGSTQPVSPWTWDLAGIVSGDEYWIREMRPGFVDKTWQLLDRQSFLVVTQPLALAAGAGFILLGILATIATTIAHWRKNHRLQLALFLLALGLLAAALILPSREENRVRAEKYANPGFRADRIAEASERLAIPMIRRVFDALYTDFDASFPAEAFAETVAIYPEESLPKAAFLTRLEAGRLKATRANQTIENVHERRLPRGDASLRRLFEFEIYSHPDGQPATGHFATLTCESLPPQSEQDTGLITAWSFDERRLYTATPRDLPLPEATAWIESLLATLQERYAPGLEDAFLPVILYTESEDRPNESPIFRQNLCIALIASFTAQPEVRLTLESEPILEPLSGARWRLTVSLHQTGPGAPRTHRWQIDLVPVGNRWQAMRLRM